MKKISYSIGIVLVLALGTLVYFNYNQADKTSDQVSDYDELKKADNPDLYLSLLNELTTKPGQDAPDYPVGYRFKEIARAKRELALLRTQETYEFIERGPSNVPGRTRGLLVDPDDLTHLTWFAGGVGGGIWKTTDGGVTWQDKATDIPNLSISWIVMAESNHDIMYAGTGEGWGASSNFIKGNGILKSTDHGETWTPLASTIENPEFEIINRIIVDPENADIVLAATSTDRRYTQNQNSGIYKSIDGGLTWVQKYASTEYVQQIIADPNNFSVQYAAESGIGVLKSTDGGETWTDSSDGLVISRRIELAVSPINSERLFASTQGDLSGSGADLYFSNDAGATWNLAVNESGEPIDFLGGQGWYDNTILAHPFNFNEVYVGGVDFWKFNVSNNDINLGNTFVGADEELTDSFLELVNFNSGVIYDNKIATGDFASEEFVSVEIRFGPDGQGSYLKQMAHRFTVPEGRGSGVADADYSYQDYVEVPFQVWDIKNNRQLMVSFRDQQRDGIFNLLKQEVEDSDPGKHSREYLYINFTDYDPNNPDNNITRNGGHTYQNMYFIWPVLPENGNWDPASFPISFFRINYKQVAGKETEFIPVADAYGRFDGNNRFTQRTGATSFTGIHPDHHNIISVIHDQSQKLFQLIVANDGGIYRSNVDTDPGVADGAWTFAGKGYNTSQFYAVDKAPEESRYIGGLQDNGTWMNRPNNEGSATAIYRRVNAGDGFGTAWNYADKSQILSTLYYNRIEKSTNEGASSVESTKGLADVGPGFGPFVTELEYYQADPEVVYTTGSKGVWKSVDFGDNWTLAEIERSLWQPGIIHSTIFARISLANPNIVWAGSAMSSDGGLAFHVSTDAGDSFNPTRNYQGDLFRASGFATHPVLDSTAFALFSYANSPKILRTDDLGQSWYDISGFESGTGSVRGFPDVSVRDLLVMPNDTSVIWAATEIGLFESTDAGDSWHLLPSNLPAIPVWDMKIVDKEVVLGSHGRGIWSIELQDLTGHVYLPEIISAAPTRSGEPAFNIRSRSALDSIILYVNTTRVAKMESLNDLSFVTMVGTGITAQSGDAYVRGFRDGRPFVSKKFSFELLNYSDALDSYANDFNDSGAGEDFFNYGFSLNQSIGLGGNSVQTRHNYESNSQYHYTLKYPIRVRGNNALINFSEIALVEPGAPDALPGTPEFKDFVVVQGSLDGVNWTNLVDPYDATYRSSWESGFGPFAIPRPDMVYFRAIDLLDSFNPGDEVIIRFLLQSDSENESWGWMIDNLKIQTETVITNIPDLNRQRKFAVYPNPVSDSRINLTTTADEGEYNITLLKTNGQVSFEKEIKIKDAMTLEIPGSLENGLYILIINGKDLRETHKLLIER